MSHRGRMGRRPPARRGAWWAARTCGLLLLVLFGGGCGAASSKAADDPLLVAAAANLTPVFTELAAGFESSTGAQVTFSFGSSGQLAQQIREGAPMDVYAAADAAFVDDVLAAGIGDPATRTTYGLGRIVIWAPRDAPRSWRDLEEVADDPDAGAIAIANPEHAPYGRAARQAFESLGLWEQVSPRVVFGENVTDTHRLAATGNTATAITALSLAIAARAEDGGVWTTIPEHLHEPLRQELLVVAADQDRADRARAFIEYVLGSDGREVLDRFGLTAPETASVASPGG